MCSLCAVLYCSLDVKLLVMCYGYSVRLGGIAVQFTPRALFASLRHNRQTVLTVSSWSSAVRYHPGRLTAKAWIKLTEVIN